ncbi:aminotransferase class IV [Paenibacillus woosongensis]|uniref:Aminotransferase class IV n=1 Tax=Paenibacillus woosongensis TaxID=307580 RepID=A0AA95I3L2_9BACL|nr:aminotransferase class IV [Paenibacillus woosongensis]WHX49200.1 aminotransferase class IV [Paenibacillus woosongensis]
MNYIGVNGVPTPSAEAVISVMDHGFMYGMGLFETFRTYGGQPFLLERHLERLRGGCRELGIRYEAREELLRYEIASLLKANELLDGYIRLTVSAGAGPLGLPPEDYTEPCVIIYVKPLPSFDSGLYTHGKELWRLSTPRNTPEGKIRLKSLHYMNNILAKRELEELIRGAHPGGVPEGLLLTAQGHLAEGIVSNLFFVREGTLYTPEIGTGILPGITRSFVLELAERSGLSFIEGRYTWDELVAAEEVFLTNSIQELVPVTALVEPGGSRYSVGDGMIGPVTEMLLDSYRRNCGV